MLSRDGSAIVFPEDSTGGTGSVGLVQVASQPGELKGLAFIIIHALVNACFSSIVFLLPPTVRLHWAIGITFAPPMLSYISSCIADLTICRSSSLLKVHTAID